ncbi:uncharacterized protein PHACADRAFT_29100 [Phanerochaete carnosa HHB-10118-sp]|uniref:Uncharacterized protein n=1 Tax=Phanerochaete carnosa (strain HHB-10118-sp) TaxID=650164 RepID=K5VX47_PHACS|nr:uncharacterized protein PHACADRAFT_29100 [Phanerochaete carnosa HHB-10118-sp]EKM56148.1 hypothetical protein PHACADRAFT_29100 [Phanerochaete carnosa HHB-10118-sp]
MPTHWSVGGNPFGVRASPRSVSNTYSWPKALRSERLEAKRARLYHPKAVDIWLEDLKPTEVNPYSLPPLIPEDQGRCVFDVTHVPIELSESLELPPTINQKSPRIVLDEYQGERNNLRKSSNWAYNWTIHAKMEAIVPRGWLTHCAFTFALTQLQLEIPHSSLALIEWAIAASKGSDAELAIKHCAEKHYFTF